MSHKDYKVQKAFWFERPDGSTFALEESAASEMYRGRQQIIGQSTQKPKFIGMSDGTKLATALREAREIEKTEGFEAAKRRIEQGHAEELESAKGNMQIPRDFSMIDYGGNPTNVKELNK